LTSCFLEWERDTGDAFKVVGGAGSLEGLEARCFGIEIHSVGQCLTGAIHEFVN
jgi:hypothetical protein